MKNFWRGRRVLVTGCTGLAGTWLVKYLLEREAHVFGLLRRDPADSNLARFNLAHKITPVRGEVGDLSLLRRTITGYEIQTVFHLAALSIISSARSSPLETFEANIRGTWNLLEAARAGAHVREVIVSSTDKAYGEKTELPYTETDALRGAHPYEVSKSCADLISYAYYATYDLPVCITRCANLYGGGDLNFSRIVPGTIRSAVRGESPVIRSDGTYVRDYLYVEDAVSAFLRLAEMMRERNLCGEAFNFSGGVHPSVIELVRQILVMMKKNMEPVILGQTTHEIKYQYLSGEKAARLLRWKPAHTLDEGLKKTIRWYCEYFKNIPACTLSSPS